MEQFFLHYSWVLVLAALWSIIWKGIALWKAARQDSKPWFVVLLILNTVGILEMFYIFVFSKYDRMAKNGDTDES